MRILTLLATTLPLLACQPQEQVVYYPEARQHYHGEGQYYPERRQHYHGEGESYSRAYREHIHGHQESSGNEVVVPASPRVMEPNTHTHE